MTSIQSHVAHGYCVGKLSSRGKKRQLQEIRMLSLLGVLEFQSVILKRLDGTLFLSFWWKSVHSDMDHEPGQKW